MEKSESFQGDKLTVLVTGATGFVGSHVLEALGNVPDLKVIAACRDCSRLLPGYKGIVREGDLLDEEYLNILLNGVDIVCHAAAWTSLWGRKNESKRLFLDPAIQFIDKAEKMGVRRFINVSTTSAASPERSEDPMSHGIPRPYWPHLCNVIEIEKTLRERASNRFQVINLRLGIFAGRRYALGLLPILLPRLRTHLVPWIAGGRTSLPLIDGRDIGQAFCCAVVAQGLDDYEGFNIVGPEVPTVREVIDFIHSTFEYPLPHFSVPFAVAFPFAWVMEKLDPIVPWEPLVTRSIIHLLEEVSADNRRAEKRLRYCPEHDWRDAVRLQIPEMEERQLSPMKMYRPVD